MLPFWSARASGYTFCMSKAKKRSCQTLNNRSQSRRHPGGHMTMKAGEANTLMDFTVWALLKYGGEGKFGQDIIQAGRAPQVFCKEIHGDGGYMPTPASSSRMHQAFDTHLRACKRAGIAFTPKHHLCAHMLHRTMGRRQQAESLLNDLRSPKFGEFWSTPPE